MQRAYNRNIKYILFFIASIIIVMLFFSLSSKVLKTLYPIKYEEYVNKYALENKLDPYLVFAVIKAESGFNPKAVSGKNAMGLMQITESTAAWGAGKLGMNGFKTEDLYDPETNIKIGCWYLGWLYEQFKEIDLVIAAYNSGNGNVSKWLKNRELSNSGEKLEKIPFKETDNFLKRVKKYREKYKSLYDKSV